jgi:tungstate transport system permease protein
LSEILSGLARAFNLILSLDAGLMEIISLSLLVSASAVLISCLFGIPLGAILGLRAFRGRRLVEGLINTMMGLPPVVAGLVIYLLLSSSGPLGVLRLLYTPGAMIIAQVVLVLPIVTGLTLVAVRSKDRRIRETARSLGATEAQATIAVLGEARLGIFGGVVAGLGRALGEVGAVMLVGGNLEGKTRVMTTAIVLETRRGEFDLAIALGIVLLVISFVINLALQRLQGEGEPA